MATDAKQEAELRMRFSLSTLMVTTFVVCVLLALIIAAPVSVSILTCNLLAYMSGPAAIGGIVYFGGYARAFSIGASLVAGWFTIGALFENSFAQAFAEDLAQFPNQRSNAIELLMVYGLMVALSGVTVIAVRALSRLSLGRCP